MTLSFKDEFTEISDVREEYNVNENFVGQA